ncbi:MAG TPA: ABC transporter ATP-binding protein [Agromyces sp.]
MAGINATRLVKEYPGGVRGVDEVDVEIVDGEFFALLGPSGCGKTTLLRSIAGLEAISSGQLVIGDRDVTDAEPGARGVAMVFQDYALFPHMDVADNIAYPLRIKRVKRDERRATAEKVGDGLSLQGLIERRPGQLSGGQQQRVALARAVATRPDVLLLDEPLSNLDARLRLEARTFLKELQRDLGVTTVFVTHDQAEALALADRIAVMKAGKLQQIGTPREVFQRPNNTFVAGFIGSNPMNLVPATVSAGAIAIGAGDVSTALPPGTEDHVREGQSVVWGVRPEYLRWTTTEEPGAIAAEVSVVENLGASVLIAVNVDGHKLQVVVPEDHEPAPGDHGYLVPTGSKTLLFDAESTERIG